MGRGWRAWLALPQSLTRLLWGERGEEEEEGGAPAEKADVFFQDDSSSDASQPRLHFGVTLLWGLSGKRPKVRSVLASPFPLQKLPWGQNEGDNILRGEHFEAPQHLNCLASNFSANITGKGRSLANASRNLGNSPSVGSHLGRLNSSVQDGPLLVAACYPGFNIGTQHMATIEEV